MNEIKEYIKQSKKVEEELQSVFIAVVILTVLLMVISIVIGFKHIKLGIDYGELQEEKEELEGTIEMQSSMIADLEENCKDLFIQLEELKEGVVYGKDL
jgi:cell division protein FtsL